MKKVILMSVFICSTISFAQTNKSSQIQVKTPATSGIPSYEIDNFIGHWISDSSDLDILIWKDKKGDFHFIELDVSNGEKSRMLTFNKLTDMVEVKSVFNNNKITKTKNLKLISDNELVLNIKADKKTFIYARMK